MKSNRDIGNEEQIIYLTLGDGDFSYSLDLARYLSENNNNGDDKRKRRQKLIATGIDDSTELLQKYKNSNSILRRLKGLAHHKNNKHGGGLLDVSVHHSVNALDEKRGDEWRSHHVIFNHPHLGIEDAQLHSRFISHFLYVVANHWLHRSGGILHLTLAKGQYERWNTQDAATQHGLVLLERNDFRPPPIIDGQAEYQHRRHQTGKSFAPRVDGSETFTFGRAKNDNDNTDMQQVATCLPWQHSALLRKTVENEEKPFSCPQCIKSFREERSLKNHMKCAHDEGKKRKRSEGSGGSDSADIVCKFCKSIGIQRIFAHTQGLEDHIRAKHTGLHANIQPDWYLKQQKSQTNEVSKSADESSASCIQDRAPYRSSGEAVSTNFGSCKICGLVYNTDTDKGKHLQEFIPVKSKIDCEKTGGGDSGIANEYFFLCDYCKKSFRERRAQLQHENFCKYNKHKTKKATCTVQE